MDRKSSFMALAEKAKAMDLVAPIMELLEQTMFMGIQTGGFFGAPASTRFHGCYAGGLYDHSEAVTLRLMEYTEKLSLTWTRPQSPFIVGMLHDLCKIDNYVGQVEGYMYNPTILDKRHAEKSLDFIKQCIELTEEEELCIRYHMGAYVKEDWSGFDKAIKKYETVLYTHTADMAASKVDET